MAGTVERVTFNKAIKPFLHTWTHSQRSDTLHVLCIVTFRKKQSHHLSESIHHWQISVSYRPWSNDLSWPEEYLASDLYLAISAWLTVQVTWLHGAFMTLSTVHGGSSQHRRSCSLRGTLTRSSNLTVWRHKLRLQTSRVVGRRQGMDWWSSNLMLSSRREAIPANPSLTRCRQWQRPSAPSRQQEC